MLKIGLFVFFLGFSRQLITFLQGPERVKRLYAFRSLIDSGARITLGSDFPVESINPLSAFYAAVTRRSPDGKSPHGPGGWYISFMRSSNFHLIRKLYRFPEQRLTRQEALRGNLKFSYRFLESLIYLFPGMTIDPAYASFTEATLGSLEPGKLADFTVLSQNIMTIAEDKILATTVDATVIDGKPVYGTI